MMRTATTIDSHRRPPRVVVATALAVALVAGGSAALAAIEPEPTEPTLTGTWSEIPDAPWGTIFPAAAFTGEEMLVVDLGSGRTQTYHPENRTWTPHETAPKAFDGLSPSVWTGTELLVFDRYKAGRNYAYDPEARRWRKLAGSPLREQWHAEWAGGQVVVRGRTKLEWAAYDVAADTWRSLSAPPGAHRLWSVHWTGDTLLAVAGGHGERLPHVVALDLGTDIWGKPVRGPAGGAPAEPEWIGDQLVFVFGWPWDDEPVADANFDPASGEWTLVDFDCPISTGHAFWTGELLVSSHFALDPDTGACRALPDRDLWEAFTEDHDRSWILSLWTGEELLFWSGANEDTSPPKSDGLAFRIDVIQ